MNLDIDCVESLSLKVLRLNNGTLFTATKCIEGKQQESHRLIVSSIGAGAGGIGTVSISNSDGELLCDRLYSPSMEQITKSTEERCQVGEVIFKVVRVHGYEKSLDSPNRYEFINPWVELQGIEGTVLSNLEG